MANALFYIGKVLWIFSEIVTAAAVNLLKYRGHLIMKLYAVTLLNELKCSKSKIRSAVFHCTLGKSKVEILCVNKT